MVAPIPSWRAMMRPSAVHAAEGLSLMFADGTLVILSVAVSTIPVGLNHESLGCSDTSTRPFASMASGKRTGENSGIEPSVLISCSGPPPTGRRRSHMLTLTREMRLTRTLPRRRCDPRRLRPGEGRDQLRRSGTARLAQQWPRCDLCASQNHARRHF
jgi:hypothetical protein